MIAVKIRAMLGQRWTEHGYPMTGLVSTPDGDYLGTVNGFIPRPEPKRKGRPKTPAEKIRQYCAFLAQWANPSRILSYSNQPRRKHAGAYSE
ncbi:hypothetical protein [Thiomonas sp. FB-Cd]|uniref:hypothetical protein n=1 Tax=Thiomonas sp. FB-Cd TaxID=1158292 RepID=UPI0012DD8269|nr:hypothetical protein [Thiomonas sp. FB-Cd]